MAKGTILVGEDHPVHLELVVDLLEAAGYIVLQPEDPRPRGERLCHAEGTGTSESSRVRRFLHQAP